MTATLAPVLRLRPRRTSRQGPPVILDRARRADFLRRQAINAAAHVLATKGHPVRKVGVHADPKAHKLMFNALTVWRPRDGKDHIKGLVKDLMDAAEGALRSPTVAESVERYRVLGEYVELALGNSWER